MVPEVKWYHYYYRRWFKTSPLGPVPCEPDDPCPTTDLLAM